MIIYLLLIYKLKNQYLYKDEKLFPIQQKFPFLEITRQEKQNNTKVLRRKEKIQQIHTTQAYKKYCYRYNLLVLYTLLTFYR